MPRGSGIRPIGQSWSWWFASPWRFCRLYAAIHATYRSTVGAYRSLRGVTLLDGDAAAEFRGSKRRLDRGANLAAGAGVENGLPAAFNGLEKIIEQVVVVVDSH